MKSSTSPFSCLWNEAPGITAPVHTLPTTARCVIIGAGYTGLSTALELAASHPGLRGDGVLVLDAMAVGEGASGRNGGQVIPGLKLNPDELIQRFGEVRGERLVEVVGGAADYTFELIERLGIDCSAQQNGWLQAAHNAAALDGLGNRVNQWQARGAKVQLLDANQTAALIGNNLYSGALLDLRAGQLQPYQYVQGLAAAARQQGVKIVERTPALKLLRRVGGWTVVTPRGEIQTEQVVIATNAYSSALLPALPHTYVTLWSLQAATAPLPAALLERILPGGLPVSDTFRVLRYYRRTADGRFVLGTRGAFRDDLNLDDVKRLQREMLHIYPELAGTPISHCWCGRVAVPASTLPLLSQPEPGLTVALGYYGRGVAMATRMGSFVAELVQGVPAQEVAYPVLPFKAMPAAPLHRSAARVAANVMRLQDLIQRRTRSEQA